MASAILTITVTDTANHSLATVRDKLLIRWDYSGGATAQEKLDFIEAKLSKYLKTEYKAQLFAEANAAANIPESDIDIQ